MLTVRTILKSLKCPYILSDFEFIEKREREMKIFPPFFQIINGEWFLNLISIRTNEMKKKVLFIFFPATKFDQKLTNQKKLHSLIIESKWQANEFFV